MPAHQKRRVPPKSQSGWKRAGVAARRMALAAALVGSAVVAGKVIGRQVFHSSPGTKPRPRLEASVEPGAQNKQRAREEKTEQRIAPRRISPRIDPQRAFFSNSLRVLNETTPQEWERNPQAAWELFAQEAYKDFKARAKLTGKRYHPLPEAVVNLICLEVARKRNLEFSLVKAIFKQEASFDPYAIGPDGGIGAGQLMPGTIVEMGKHGAKMIDPFNPVQNLNMCMQLFERYTQSARIRTVNVGTTRNPRFVGQVRVYNYGSRQIPFDQLPREIQIQIVGRLYNAGTGVFEAQRDGSYNVNDLISNAYSEKLLKHVSANGGL